MPEKSRLNKPSLEYDVSDRGEPKHSSREEQAKPPIAHERRTRSRRSEDAAGPIADAMDVALGAEDDAWDRRHSARRKDAA